MAGSIALFACISALFLDLEQVQKFGLRETLAKERIADIEQIFREKMPCVLLNAAGSTETHEDDSYRIILFFNGMPIGIDCADSMDYKSLGHYETDLPAFVAETKSKYHQPIVWICPRDTVPFSLTSFFAPNGKVFSDKFVNDFYRYFHLSGHSACFDLYEETSN